MTDPKSWPIYFVQHSSGTWLLAGPAITWVADVSRAWLFTLRETAEREAQAFGGVVVTYVPESELKELRAGNLKHRRYNDWLSLNLGKAVCDYEAVVAELAQAKARIAELELDK